MPKMLDRRRLKDRIIESISKAVKQVQEQHFCCPEGPKGNREPLSNGHWSVNKLCEHLDHAFLHGLRHITNGYWVVVKEFTHKAVVKDVGRLQHVTTHLGRGRAWLYMALNDQLLECYLRCFMANTTLVRKFYVQEALVMDQQQMELLITLASGLEFVTFQMEVDLPYLDLSSSMPMKERPQTVVDEDSADSDQLSLCSMDSSMSQGSLPTLDSGRSQVDGDSGSQKSGSSPHCSLLSALESSSSISACDVDENAEFEYAQNVLDGTEINSVLTRDNSRIRRIEAVDIENDLDFENGSVEVIHVKSKASKMRKKKAHKKDVLEGNLVVRSNESLTHGISSISEKPPESDTLLTNGSVDGLNNDISHGDAEQTTGNEINLGRLDLSNVNFLEQTDVSSKDTSSCNIKSNEPVAQIPIDSSQDVTEVESEATKLTTNEEVDYLTVTDVSKPHIPETFEVSDCNTDSAGVCSSEIVRLVIEDIVADITSDTDSLCVGNGEADESGNNCSSVNESGAVSNCDRSNDSVHRQVAAPHGQSKASVNENGAGSIERLSDNLSSVQAENRQEDNVSLAQSNEIDVYNCSNSVSESSLSYESDNQKKDCISPSVRSENDVVETEGIEELSTISGSATDMKSTSPCLTVTQNSAGQNFDMSNDSLHYQVTAPPKQPKTSTHSSEVKIDNNALLWLMLEIFEDEEEQFVKMFLTSQGHTLGEIEPLYLLLTSMRIYLLTREAGESKYKKYSTIKYRELDFISLSLNYQYINLVCVNRRKQFWLTTGDQTLTKCIVGHMDNVVRHSEYDLPRLSVLTDATTQKISMRKFAAAECGCERADLSILCYSLVHWEDLNSIENLSKAGACPRVKHEGVLLHKSYSYYFGTPTWKPFYFMLRDGVLHQYSEQGDSAGPVWSIQLCTEQVAGCRRSPHNDREHSFEILLADGASFQLSAVNEKDAQDWLMSLCQAVAEGQGVTMVTHDCLACCVVLTQTKVLMCHEDVQTNFFRLLGSARISDVTSVLVDPVSSTYCVLVFESKEAHVNSEKWALYFNTSEERDNFITVLSHTWNDFFQVTLPVIETEDVNIQKKCREGVAVVKAIFCSTSTV